MTLERIDPGSFSNRISVYRETLAPDGCGGFETGSEPVCECWADLEPVNGQQAFATGISETRITHRVRLRYRDDVTSGMHFIFKSRAFEIISAINPLEAGHYLVLEARERT